MLQRLVVWLTHAGEESETYSGTLVYPPLGDATDGPAKLALAGPYTGMPFAPVVPVGPVFRSRRLALAGLVGLASRLRLKALWAQ